MPRRKERVPTVLVVRKLHEFWPDKEITPLTVNLDPDDDGTHQILIEGEYKLSVDDLIVVHPTNNTAHPDRSHLTWRLITDSEDTADA